jgi:hypothetical protein
MEEKLFKMFLEATSGRKCMDDPIAAWSMDASLARPEPMRQHSGPASSTEHADDHQT